MGISWECNGYRMSIYGNGQWVYMFIILYICIYIYVYSIYNGSIIGYTGY